MILIDTSVWVAFFRDQKPTAQRLESLLDVNAVALAGPIVTELLRGVAAAKERARLLRLLSGCHVLPDPANLWEHAGELGAQLRKKGANVKTLDLLIATYALLHNVPLFTLDSDFALMRKAGIPLMLA